MLSQRLERSMSITVQNEFYERMNNMSAYRTYALMIRTSELDVVQNLYDNLSTHVSNHPKYPQLHELFKERLGVLI